MFVVLEGALVAVGGDDVGDTGRIHQGADWCEEEIVGQDGAVGASEGADQAQGGIEDQNSCFFIRDQDLPEFLADKEARRL